MANLVVNPPVTPWRTREVVTPTELQLLGDCNDMALATRRKTQVPCYLRGANCQTLIGPPYAGGTMGEE
jgi:hypothetical protein